MIWAQKIGKAIRISRPIFWPAPFAAYAAGVIAGGVSHSPFVIWELLLATFPLSFAVYFLNDYFDMPYDAKNPRKSGVWGHQLTDEDAAWAWKLCALFAILAILTAIISLNIIHAILIAAGMILPFIYSAPPIRLKNIPVVDSLSNIGYAFIPFAAGACLGGSWVFLDYRFLVAITMVAAFHAIAAIMDYQKDKQAGQNTFAVALGPRAPALFAAFIFLLNIVILFPYFSLISLGVYLAFLLSLLLALRPSPANAKLVFKILFAHAIMAGYLLLFKYVLLAGSLADYGEAEIGFFINECHSNPEGPLSFLCPTLEQIENDCIDGTENPALPGFCDYLSRSIT